jgi:hypothetical protein
VLSSVRFKTAAPGDVNVILLRKCAIVFAAILSTTPLSVAQDRAALMAQINNTKAFLLKQRTAPDYRDSVRKAVLVYQGTLGSDCKAVDLDFDSVNVRDRILALLELDKNGTAVAGAWKESVPGTACNEKRTYNVQVDVTRTGLRFTPTFPGDAAGDPELQNDTLKNIEINLQMLKIPTKASCHLAVIDTHLVGAPSAVLDSGAMSPWTESWDVQTCGKVYAVPVTYTPDARGTRISVGTSDIQPR